MRRATPSARARSGTQCRGPAGMNRSGHTVRLRPVLGTFRVGWTRPLCAHALPHLLLLLLLAHKVIVLPHVGRARLSKDDSRPQWRGPLREGSECSDAFGWRCGVRPTALVRRAHAPCAGPPDRSAQRHRTRLCFAPQCTDRLRRPIRNGSRRAQSVSEPCRRRRRRRRCRRRRQGSVRAASAKIFGSHCANSEIPARSLLVRSVCVPQSMQCSAAARHMCGRQHGPTASAPSDAPIRLLSVARSHAASEWPEVRLLDEPHRALFYLLQLPVYRADRRPHFFDEALPLLQLCTR